MKSNQNIVIKVVAGFISRKYMIFVVICLPETLFPLYGPQYQIEVCRPATNAF